MSILHGALAASGLLLAASAAPDGTKEVAEAGVRFRWAIEADQLKGCMEAATQGWVAVGFNTRGQLDGARLVMARVVDGRAHAEVHLAKPPQHFHRRSKDGGERVSAVSGSVQQGRTNICFSMPLAAADSEDVVLIPGKPVHLILAWSHEADFQHHSAQRGSRDTVL